MVSDFILQYAKLVVNYPADVRVEQNEISDQYDEIIIKANKKDVGLLIGKDGKMINAIKTMVTGCKAKNSKSYKINIQPADG
jgi:predicted RNA-binding protein YlqC (UPF0109 family)